jgi:hypothetical protein
VYSLLLTGFQDRQPWDLSEPHNFKPRGSDESTSLRDWLQGGLSRAMQDK